jgi:hypothetical protein
MVPSALKCYGKASRKEEKVTLFKSRGVERKLHRKTKKACPSDAKGGEERRGCDVPPLSKNVKS